MQVELSPEIAAYALLMERKRQANQAKKGDSYQTTPLEELLLRWEEERGEFAKEVLRRPGDPQALADEMADVGNFEWMILYRLGVLFLHMEEQLKQDIAAAARTSQALLAGFRDTEIKDRDGIGGPLY